MIAVKYIVFYIAFILTVVSGCSRQENVIKQIQSTDSPDMNAEVVKAGFFAEIDKQIRKFVPEYPQLADWDLQKRDPHWWSTGKKLTENELTYSHSLSPTKSSNYRDWYGKNGCRIRVAVHTEDEFRRLSGPGIKTRIFGLKMIELRIIATVITENPEVPELEQKINNIIHSAATSVQH